MHGSQLSLCHKEPARSKQKAPSRGLWMRRAGSLWYKSAGVAIPWNSPPNRGGPVRMMMREPP